MIEKSQATVSESLHSTIAQYHDFHDQIITRDPVQARSCDVVHLHMGNVPCVIPIYTAWNLIILDKKYGQSLYRSKSFSKGVEPQT